MDVKINRLELLRAVKRTLRISSVNSGAVPVLSCVRLEAKDNAIEIKRTNLRTSMQMKIPAHVYEPNAAAVGAKLLADILSLMPEDVVELSMISENSLIVSSGACKYTLNTYASRDFPGISIPFPEGGHSMPGVRLCSLIRDTAFAADGNSAPGNLNCVNGSADDGTLTFIALDSTCLSQVKTETVGSGNINFKVPAEDLARLSELFGETESVRIGMANNMLVFSCADWTASIQLVTGDIFDFERFAGYIKPDFSVTVHSAHLREALGGASVFASKVCLAVEKDTLIVKSRQETGLFRTSIEACTPDGIRPRGYWFDSGKLIQASSKTAGRVKLRFTVEGHLIIEGDSFFYWQAGMREPQAKPKEKTRKVPAKSTKSKEAA